MTSQLIRTDTTGFPLPDDNDDGPSLSLRIRNLLYTYPIISPLVVLLLAVIVFSLLTDRFLSPTNLSLISQQVMVIGIAAAGQTIIILTAGIDLSVGMLAVFVSIVMAKLNVEFGVPGPIAILIGLLVGTASGAGNGLLVVVLKLPPFIATLGTLSVFYALGLYFSDGAALRGVDMHPMMLFLGRSFKLGGTNIAWGVLLLVILVIVAAYALQRTAWGRHVYAVGDDPAAARLSGIRSKAVLFSVYAAAGLLYAVAAWALIGRSGAASPQAAAMLNLDTITAVVIGGTSLFGGRGLVVGTLFGALIVGIFRNGLALIGVDMLWQEFAVGMLIIGAVALDQWIRKDAR